METYTLEEINEALADATIAGEVIRRLTNKVVLNRYFMVSYTAVRGGETIAGATFLTIKGSKYLNVGQFIKDTKDMGGYSFVVPTNIIELNENDYNDAKS